MVVAIAMKRRRGEWGKAANAGGLLFFAGFGG